jgi:hypothetical protein
MRIVSPTPAMRPSKYPRHHLKSSGFVSGHDGGWLFVADLRIGGDHFRARPVS